MNKRLLIFGGTGLLGNTVTKYFDEAEGYSICYTHRSDKCAHQGNSIFFDALESSLENIAGHFDYVINCIGIIKPFMESDPEAAIRINSLFPWELSKWCRSQGARLIHITTDCVYSGSKGKYIESDSHDGIDAYGKSKSLGECSNAMVLRTSIIGEETHKFASLLSWAKNQQGKTVQGYASHIWNGVTTQQYARICHQIIEEDLYEDGLFHVFAKNDVTKYQMLHCFNEKFGLDLKIEETYPPAIDRTLRTEKSLCEKLMIPTVQQMIKEI